MGTKNTYAIGALALGFAALLCLSACGDDRVVGGTIGSLCSSSSQCPSEGYCNTSAGSPGKCEKRPQACDQVYSPVCGSDDKTYGNACEAAAAGVSVKHDGECGSPKGCVGPGGVSYAIGDQFKAPDGCNTCTCTANGAACTEMACAPGSCTSNSQCKASEYCELSSCGGVGLCAQRPQACTDHLEPVCGCDDKTYSNPCEAATAGASVAYKGECRVPGQCQSDKDCADATLYCAKTSCDASAKGQCKKRPQGCIDLWAPVCGCDGKTYGNDCDAAAAGVNVASKGECKAAGCKSSDGTHYNIGDTFPSADGCNECTCTQSGIACTKKNCAPKACTSNTDCSVAGTFCKLPAGKCGGSGSCAVKPQACIEIYSPVCGCDGKTYDNSCFAEGAGTSVASTGACAP